MGQLNRVLTVIIGGDNPRSHVAEFLNNLEEDEERAVLDWLRSPEFAVFAVCREIEMDEFADGGEWFPAETNPGGAA